MTVKELKDKLNNYPDDYGIDVIDEDCNSYDLIDVDNSQDYSNCITLFILQ